MINSRKKGFTLVELVIVIAVVAVLAAVLIPTFSSLVKKANMSADTQAVRQMNMALVVEGTDNEVDFEKALDVLSKAGYNAFDTLVPVSTGYNFYWLLEKNTIVLSNDKGEIIFPENYKDFDLGKAISEEKAFNLKKGAPATEVSDATGLKNAISKGQNITLNADYADKETFNVENDVTINLNGKDFDASTQGTRPFDLADGATLTINAEGSEIKCGSYGLLNIQPGASVNVIINGGTIKANTDDGAFIKVRPGSANVNITLNNVNYVDSSSNGWLLDSGALKDNTLNLTINGGSFKASAGMLIRGNCTIENATFETSAMAFEILGTGIIKNCEIIVGSKTVSTAPAAAVAVSNGGSATVTGCTITCNGTPAVYHVYSGDGTINYSNNTVSGTYGVEYKNSSK